MKNKIFKLFLVLIILISFTGCSLFEEEKEIKTNEEENKENSINNNDALIWEVKSDTATIYLVGSIHVGRESTYPLQQKLLDAFNASDAIAVEADVEAAMEDEEVMMEMSYAMIYTDGTTLKDYVSEETLELFNEYVEKHGVAGLGIEYIDALYLYKPWALSSVIESELTEEAGLDADLGIDSYFINEARNKGMEVIEIESVEFQSNMFNDVSDELNEFMLKETLETSRDSSKITSRLMMALWEKGDVEGFEILLEDDLSRAFWDYTEEELQLYDEYNKVMSIDRNIGMADKVEELLQGDKDIFYIVGSAHMIGDDSVIAILKERGYEITKI